MTLYKVHPYVQYKRSTNGRVDMSLPSGQKCLRATESLASRIQSVQSAPPQTEPALVNRLGKGVFNLLVKHAFLLANDDADALAGGISTPANNPVGIPVSPSELYTLDMGALLIVHAPISTTQCREVSVAGGGRWVRAHLAQTLSPPDGGTLQSSDVIDLDFGGRLDGSALQIFDLGDIVSRPMFDRASDIGKRAAHVCRTVVSRDAIPILLGGDHALAHYSIGALANRYPELGVLQFDAHPDLYSSGGPRDSELNHANVMHSVLKMPHVCELWQVGLRDFYRQSTRNLSRVLDPKLNTLSAFEAETIGYRRLLDNMDPKIPWFISFDVDALASSDIPETSTPVLGGLSFYPLLACFEELLREFHICGVEFVEIGDAMQKAHGTAAVAARLISRLIFHKSNVVPIHNVVYR